MSKEKYPHSGSGVASSVLKASCPEQTRSQSPSLPHKGVLFPFSPEIFPHGNQKGMCCRDSHAALSVGHVPWDFKAGYLTFYPAKESQHGFLVKLERGTEPGTYFPFLMEKGTDHRGFANGEGGSYSLPSRDSLWYWKFLRAPRSPSSVDQTQVPGGMDYKILYLFVNLSFTPR